MEYHPTCKWIETEVYNFNALRSIVAVSPSEQSDIQMSSFVMPVQMVHTIPLK